MSREKKWTPGPWASHNAGNQYGTGDVFEIHFSDDGECVSEITHGEANAALISAAPELVEALEKLTPYLDGVKDSGPQWDRYKSDGFTILIDKARAAIAKAYGETP